MGGLVNLHDDNVYNVLEGTGQAGLPELGPKVYKCPLCGSSWHKPDEMAYHVAGAHPLERPFLTLTDREAGHDVFEAEALSNASFHSCSSVLLTIDGEESSSETLNPSQALQAIRQLRAAYVSLELLNERAADAARSSTTYRFAIRIPDRAELDAIDAFYRERIMLNSGRQRMVRADLGDSTWAAQPYRDAIYEFQRGIDERDDCSRHSGAALRQAASVLENFVDRRLPRALLGVISLALDDTSTLMGYCGLPHIDLARHYFAEKMMRPTEMHPEIVAVMHELRGKEPACRVDDTLLKTIDLVVRIAAQESLTDVLSEACSLLEAPLPAQHDRARLTVVAADAAIRLRDRSATRLLTQLSGEHRYSTWARTVTTEEGVR